MKTKLILGLTVSLAAIAQSGHAQGVNSGPASDTFVDTTSVATDVVTAPAVRSESISFVADTLPGSAFIADASPMNTFNAAANSSDAAPLLTSWNYSDVSAPQSLSASVAGSVAVDYSAGATKPQKYNDYSGNSANWLSLDSSVGFGMPATASMASSLPSVEGSDYAMNPAMDNNAEGVLRQEDKASASSKGGGRMPLLASPEPGTVSLLVMGGAAIVGAVRRRK